MPTIAGNTSTVGPAALFLTGGTLSNNIIVGNQTNDVNNETLASVVQGGNLIGTTLSQDGVGLQTVDLKNVFVDANGDGSASLVAGDIRIKFKSPTLDAGDVSFLGSVTTDINGDPRLVEFQPGAGVLDLGAVELQRLDQPAVITLQIAVFGENQGGSTGTPVSIDDPDAEDMPSIAGIVANEAFGVFIVSPDGTTLSYTLNDNAPDLAAGQLRDDTAQITADDGTTGTLTTSTVG